MNKRMIGQLLAKAIVGMVVKNFVQNSLESNIRATQRLHTAEITGMVASGVVLSRFDSRINSIVDDLIARQEAVRS